MDDFTNCETSVKLNGKVAIVTGATSGTGLDVAKNLSKRAAKVIIASRNKTKLNNAREEIMKASGRNDVIVREMDFKSLTSVRNFVDVTFKTEPKVDILINNIGAYGLQDKLTEDGLQTMMQVNYFGTFLLTYLLFPLLRKSAPSRIVNVSSFTLLLGNINFDHWNEVGAYSNLRYYSNAKLATVLFTAEIERRVAGSGVSVMSVDPGLIQSDFFRNVNNNMQKILLSSVLQSFGRPTDRVANMHVYIAADPRANRSGAHFKNCKESFSHWKIYDTVLARKLWMESKRLVGIKLDEDWEINNKTKS